MGRLIRILSLNNSTSRVCKFSPLYVQELSLARGWTPVNDGHLSGLRRGDTVIRVGDEFGEDESTGTTSMGAVLNHVREHTRQGHVLIREDVALAVP
jgi:hypothetical protein